MTAKIPWMDKLQAQIRVMQELDQRTRSMAEAEKAYSAERQAWKQSVLDCYDEGCSMVAICETTKLSRQRLHAIMKDARLHQVMEEIAELRKDIRYRTD